MQDRSTKIGVESKKDSMPITHESENMFFQIKEELFARVGVGDAAATKFSKLLFEDGTVSSSGKGGGTRAVGSGESERLFLRRRIWV